MKTIFENSIFFGVIISILAYGIGTILQKKFKIALFNPLLIAIIITIGILKTGKISYSDYYSSAKYLNWLLTPATVCLAVPLYEQFEIIKRNKKAILISIIIGILTSFIVILSAALILGFSHQEYVTFLPKSITVAIGMGLSEELGGYTAITVIIIAITGITGNMFADTVCKFFKITNPIAKGLSTGVSSHAIGTVKAMEMGELEGAVSGLALVLTGIFSVIGAGLFASLY